jgi:hypothetical protein
MSELTTLLGPDVRQWLTEILRSVAVLPPLLTALLALPVIVAAVSRSFVSLVVSLLIASVCVTLLVLPGPVEHRWILVQASCLASLLAALGGGLHRRSKNRLRQAAGELASLRARHADTTEKYEREVQWRQAAGRAGASWGEIIPPGQASVPPSAG